MDSSIRVIVRIRPFLHTDLVKRPYISVRKSTFESWLFQEVLIEPPSSSNGSSTLPSSPKAFTFDQVYGPDSRQTEIYDDIFDKQIAKFLSGVNCTVLAYGQTGSGKSYTMGTINEKVHGVINSETGVIPRAICDIFTRMHQRKTNALESGMTIPEYTISCSFIELYNEELHDLLKSDNEPNAALLLREDPSGQVFLTGAKEVELTSMEEAMACLIFGLRKRQTAKTAMNETSSRSHAIFTLNLKQTIHDARDLDPEVSESLGKSRVFPLNLTSKLNFVDLAGSERLKKTQASGSRQKEGISINQGLLVLGKVVNALAASQFATFKKVIPPYRESKLTRLLQDSLGGNSQTLIVTCVNPSEQDFSETINTLHYATRAKIIKNQCKVNMIVENENESKAKRQIATLLQELKYWRERQAGFEKAQEEHAATRLEIEELKQQLSKQANLLNKISIISKRHAFMGLDSQTKFEEMLSIQNMAGVYEKALEMKPNEAWSVIYKLSLTGEAHVEKYLDRDDPCSPPPMKQLLSDLFELKIELLDREKEISTLQETIADLASTQDETKSQMSKMSSNEDLTFLMRLGGLKEKLLVYSS